MTNCVRYKRAPGKPKRRQGTGFSDIDALSHKLKNGLQSIKEPLKAE
jgi:hypothetical protein